MHYGMNLSSGYSHFQAFQHSDSSLLETWAGWTTAGRLWEQQGQGAQFPRLGEEMAQPQPLTTGWWHHAAMHHLSQGNRHGTRNLCVVPWRRRMYSLALKCHSSGSTGSPAVTTHTLPSAGLCKAAPCAALASAVLPPKAAYRTNSAPRVVLTATCNPAWW